MMKRTIFGIILVGLVSACGDPYTQTIEHDLSFLNKTRSFTARNDSKAYESAYKHFIHYVKTQRDNYGLSPDGFVLVNTTTGDTIQSSVVDSTILANICKKILGISKKEYDSQVSRRIAERLAERARRDSLTRVAWGEARFGMTRTEIEATPQFKGMRKTYSNKDYCEYEASSATNNSIAKAIGLSRTPTLCAKFKGKDNNELTEVSLNSPGYTSLYFDSMKEDTEKLVSFISQKYGKPSIHNPDIKSYELNCYGETKTVALWILDAKSISIWMDESFDYLKYYVVLIINKNYPQKVSASDDLTQMTVINDTLIKEMF